jgi:hypothetical protein
LGGFAEGPADIKGVELMTEPASLTGLVPKRKKIEAGTD